MRSITTFDLQYAHRFYGFQGEAQYLHGHTGKLTIEVEDSIEAGVNMVYPCNEIQKVAWDVLRNFDHALVLREDDPLLPAVLDVYEKQGIRNGHPQNKMKGPAFKTELATALDLTLQIVERKAGIPEEDDAEGEPAEEYDQRVEDRRRHHPDPAQQPAPTHEPHAHAPDPCADPAVGATVRVADVFDAVHGRSV